MRKLFLLCLVVGGVSNQVVAAELKYKIEMSKATIEELEQHRLLDTGGPRKFGTNQMQNLKVQAEGLGKGSGVSVKGSFVQWDYEKLTVFRSVHLRGKAGLDNGPQALIGFAGRTN